MTEGNIIANRELCRLCLRTPGLEDIFTKKDLIEDIYLCTGVMVFESYHLPRRICLMCLETVTNAKHLRIIVKQNETHMKIFYGINLNKDEVQQVDEAIKELENISKSKDNTETKSPEADNTDTNDKDNISNAIKRQRSSSSENVQTQKLFIRKDLYTSAKNVTIPGTEGTYTEGTKYGISKTCTTNKSGDIDVTYTCAMCPKTFPTWKKVYFHKRTHNKDRMCPKEECGKKFATNGDLQKHMRTHTGERPYNCDLCNKSFSQRVTLKAHKESVHPPSDDSDSDRLVIDLNN